MVLNVTVYNSQVEKIQVMPLIECFYFNVSFVENVTWIVVGKCLKLDIQFFRSFCTPFLRLFILDHLFQIPQTFYFRSIVPNSLDIFYLSIIYAQQDFIFRPNVIEIEGLLFPSFVRVLANARAPLKTGFSHQVMSKGC